MKPQRAHPLSIWVFFISKSGTINVQIMALWGRTYSVQVEHLEGAWHQASPPQPALISAPTGLRSLLLSPLRFSACEGWGLQA